MLTFKTKIIFKHLELKAHFKTTDWEIDFRSNERAFKDEKSAQTFEELRTDLISSPYSQIKDKKALCLWLKDDDGVLLLRTNYLFHSVIGGRRWASFLKRCHKISC